MHEYLLRFCSSRSKHIGEKACLATEARSRDDEKTSCITPVFFVLDIYTSTFAAVRRIWMYTGRAREGEKGIIFARCDAIGSSGGCYSGESKYGGTYVRYVLGAGAGTGTLPSGCVCGCVWRGVVITERNGVSTSRLVYEEQRRRTRK